MPGWQDEEDNPSPKPRHASQAPADVLAELQANELRWPLSTRLILGRDELKLMKQSPSIRKLCHHTFTTLRVVLISDNPFPDTIARDEMIKRSMQATAKSLGKEYKDILNRLKVDAFYA